MGFTTLEKRKECYDKEVEFNSLISPELYLGVVPIVCDSAGEIIVDPPVIDGDVVEYAIKMKQCDQKSVMKKLLQNDSVTPEQIIGLGKIIATFHSKAPMSEEISSYGNMETVRGNWTENFEQTEGAKEKLISSGDFDLIKKKVENFLANNVELIQKRVDQGHIKHCHGDLHSGNVFIEDNEIIIFDGIVFNKRFPNCDTIRDICFMILDLEFHGREDFACLLLETYQSIAQDPDISALADFYKCYLAYVRGKIQFFVYSDPSVPKEAKESIAAEGKKYFALSKQYAMRL